VQKRFRQPGVCGFIAGIANVVALQSFEHQAIIHLAGDASFACGLA
jgi:hypothetical protein